MKEILVVANRTLGGKKLLEQVRARAAGGDVRFRLVVPQSKPSAGLVIYDEAVRESAQVRVDLAISLVAGEGIEAIGEVGDPDPFSATMDAIAERRPERSSSPPIRPPSQDGCAGICRAHSERLGAARGAHRD